MSKRRRHVHARSYWGEGDATHLLAWLNSKTRAANDSIETLVRLNCELVEPDFAKELMGFNAAQKIKEAAHEFIYQSNLTLRPYLKDVTPQRWVFDWSFYGGKNQKLLTHQALDKVHAFFGLKQLAEKGLLASVKSCAWRECKKWFFARFLHQEFCSTRCQQRAAHSTQTWKEKRKRYMKELRRTMRLREERGRRREQAGVRR